MTDPQAPFDTSFETQSLWPRIQEQSKHALACGALLSIPTQYEWIQQDGISFLVRIVDNLRRKEQAQRNFAKAKPKPDFNPFLPYESDLFVTNVSATHLVLLNKFNVMDDHILIVTREFEAQSDWLTPQDFVALWRCLFEIDGLAFYNGGKLAGASQKHKHLQLVPVPLATNGPRIPIEPLIQDAYGNKNQLSLPFHQAIAQWEEFSTPEIAAQETYRHYLRLMEQIGMGNPQESSQPGAYNLLVTRHWMMAVPRSQEHFERISINSLGFAGALLVRNADQLNQLKQIGPMKVLQEVGVLVPNN